MHRRPWRGTSCCGPFGQLQLRPVETLLTLELQVSRSTHIPQMGEWSQYSRLHPGSRLVRQDAPDEIGLSPRPGLDEDALQVASHRVLGDVKRRGRLAE